MKIIILIAIMSSFSYAGEVATDCSATNQSREKITKDVSAKQRKGSSRVVGQ